MRKNVTVTSELAYSPGPGIFVPADQFTLPALTDIPPAQPLHPSTAIKVSAGVLGFLTFLTALSAVLCLISGEIGLVLLFTGLTMFGGGICHTVLIKRYRPARQALIARCDMALDYAASRNNELLQAERILESVNRPHPNPAQKQAQDRIQTKAAELTTRARVEADLKRIRDKEERIRQSVTRTRTTSSSSETIIERSCSGEVLVEYKYPKAPTSLEDEDLNTRLFIERASEELRRGDLPIQMTPQELYERGLAAEKDAINEYAANLDKVVDDLITSEGLELQAMLHAIKRGMGQADGLTRTERQELLRRYAQRRLNK